MQQTQPNDWQSLFDQFIREKRFLTNAAQKTIIFYRETWSVYRKFTSELTKESLNNFIMSLQERNLKVGGCNARIRGLNSFLSWLHENGHTPTRLKLKQLKQEKRVLRGFTDAQIQAFIKWKPNGFYEHRLHTMILFMLDTGARVTEVCELPLSNVDTENLLITIKGKGSKTRIVPMSFQFRKTLIVYLKYRRGKPGDLLFPSNSGLQLIYENLLREFNKLCRELGVERIDGAFHGFRRSFAKNFLRMGGDAITLMRILGHSSLEETKKYVFTENDDLIAAQAKTSLLSRLS